MGCVYSTDIYIYTYDFIWYVLLYNYDVYWMFSFRCQHVKSTFCQASQHQIVVMAVPDP